jgi:hypothetical protein
MAGFSFTSRPQLAEALALMCPGSMFRCDVNPETGDYDYDHVVWQHPEDTPWVPPAKAEVEAYLEQIQTEWDTNVKYKQLRKVSYPDVGAQLDALWHAMDENIIPRIEPMYSDVKAIKDQFTKNDPDLPWRGTAMGTIKGAFPDAAIMQNPAISLPEVTYEYIPPPITPAGENPSDVPAIT